MGSQISKLGILDDAPVSKDWFRDQLDAAKEEMDHGGFFTPVVGQEVTTQEAIRALQAMRTSVPATATSTGTVGQWASDANFFYVCHATNTWRRVALVSW